MPTLHVLVAAYSGDPPTTLILQAEEFIKNIKEACREKLVLLLGGYRGLMKHIADIALREDIDVVFVIPTAYEYDYYPENSIVVKSGLGDRERSSILVRSADKVVVMGGGLGTIFEILLAQSYGKEVYILLNTGLPTDKFTEFYQEKVRDPRFPLKAYYASSGRELAHLVCRE